MNAKGDMLAGILIRTQQRAKMRRLVGKLTRIDAKLAKIGPRPVGLRRERYFRLLSDRRRIEAELQRAKSAGG